MRKTKSLSITLTHELAEMVGRKVASGEYASESEVIRDGLRALQQHDDAFQQWLRTEGVARHRASIAHPERAISSAAVRKELAAHAAGLRPRKRRHAA